MTKVPNTAPRLLVIVLLLLTALLGSSAREGLSASGGGNGRALQAGTQAVHQVQEGIRTPGIRTPIRYDQDYLKPSPGVHVGPEPPPGYVEFAQKGKEQYGVDPSEVPPSPGRGAHKGDVPFIRCEISPPLLGRAFFKLTLPPGV